MSDANPSAALLDNPIWNALSTDHFTLALGDDRARRYPSHIGPLSGIPDQSAESYDALGELAGDGHPVVLFSKEPLAPAPGWRLVRGGFVLQMVAPAPLLPVEIPLPPAATLRLLGPDDAPAMVALAELTEPGPFRLRTLELGSFFGVFDGARLVAMAGMRLHLPGYIEVSGVCTHPDARGHGYARLLMARVMERIRAADRTPVLHVMEDNATAVRAYEKLGFVSRQRLHLGVLRRH